MRSASLSIMNPSPSESLAVAERTAPSPMAGPRGVSGGAAPSGSAGERAGGPETYIWPERESRSLLAVARAIVPGGAVLPPAGPRVVARVQRVLADGGPALVAGYRGLLGSLAGLSWLRHGRALPDLSPEVLHALLEGLYTGGATGRLLLRGLASAIKAVYFDDPAIFAALGQRYRDGHPTEQAAYARGVPDDMPAAVRGRTTRASDVPHGETIECDVVIIGSGAGGAVAAYELAAAGHAVVLLEEGVYFGRQDFTGSTFRMDHLLLRDMGLTTTIGNVPIIVPTGRTVGGTTTVNSGTCYRMPDRVAHHWEQQLGLGDYGRDALAPFYDRVEAVLGVDYGAPQFLGAAAAAVARGADALGYRHKPLRRNAPDCDGQGLCCFGCPTDAKRSTNVSYVPQALRAGAQLFVGAQAQRLILEGGRAVGVEVESRFPHGPGGTLRPHFRVRAQAVIVACGALGSAVFLQSDARVKKALSRSGALGHNLTIHPAAGVFGIMPELVNSAGLPSIPQSYAIEEFHDEGLLMEGVATPADLSAVTVTLFGRRFMEVMEAFPHMAGFGFMLEDSTSGSVTPGPGRRPIVRYSLADHDVARLKRGVDILSRVFFAAGAKQVLTPVHGFEIATNPAALGRLHQAPLSPAQFDLTAYHPLGTVRMGVLPEGSVVNPDLEAHDLPGLYVMDGSVLPTSPAVNPQLTIMAIASRAAGRLAGRL